MKFIDQSGLKIFADQLRLWLQDQIRKNGIPDSIFELVDELPEQGKKDVIYLTTLEKGKPGNQLSEHIWINNRWEKLGELTADIDIPLEKGEAENSAVLAGEYEGYSNKAISQTSMAVGAGTIAGLKGWYYSKIDFTNKKITLSDKPTYTITGIALIGGSWNSGTPNIKKGDLISLVNDSKYDYCGEVASVNENVITLKENLPFTKLAIDAGAASAVPLNKFSDGYSIYLPDRPDAGIIDFGGGAFAEGGLGTKASNICAHAEGLTTHAYGQYSHTEGRETKAGYAAHAEGRKTWAKGTKSHSEGYQTISNGESAHAEGYSEVSDFNNFNFTRDDKSLINDWQTNKFSLAKGKASHSEGLSTLALSTGAHAEGYRTIAEGGEGSHSEGYLSHASGKSSHAEGRSTYATNVASHAEGAGTYADGEYSHAEGNNTYATAWGAHSEGQTTRAEARFSHTEGYKNNVGESEPQRVELNTTELGLAAHAEGQSNLAKGNSSHVEGLKNNALGRASHAEGQENTSEGNLAHAEGYQTHAKGGASHTSGYGTIATNENEFACGRFNISTKSDSPDKATLFSIGSGTRETPKNVHEITKDGKHYILGIGGYDGTNPSESNDVATVINNLEENGGEGDYLPREEFEERIEGYATQDSVQELSEELTELSEKKANKSDVESELAAYLTQKEVEERFQPIGSYATSEELTELSEQIKEVSERVDALGEGGNSPIVEGEVENSAIFNGEVEYLGQTYKNRAISQTAIALGGNTISGLKGYYITYVDFDTKEIWVHNERPQSDLKVTFEWEQKVSTNANKVQYSAGGLFSDADKISIICNGRYYNCGEIKSISGNKIVLKESLPFTQDDVNEILELNSSININRHDELTLFVISKPDVGPVDLGGTSLAEGLDSKAIGGASHAEGYQTVAYGKYSHTEGYQTEAGYRAHAEGYISKATGENSHSEGRENESIGNCSHAEGSKTVARGNYSHAEGYKTRADGGASHAEGSSTEAWENAHSEGLRTKAFGENSHSEGRDTVANGDSAHAEGTNTNASKFAHAEGWTTTASGDASHSEGSTTVASGPSSHAEGYTTTASGDNSHAEGESTKATNYNSHAEGKLTVASGEHSHAEGQETQAIGTASHAEGVKTKASEWASHVEGYNCETGGNAEVNDKEADEDNIEGQMAHAEGNSTIARGNASHAEGTKTIAVGKCSHAQNYKTQAIGIESHAEGSNTKAYGATSHAEGYKTETHGENSHGEGEGTKTTNTNEHAEGQYNVSNKDSDDFGAGLNTIHSVGIGSSSSYRKNAHEIMQNGDHYIYNIGDYDGTNPESATDLATIINGLIDDINLIKNNLGIE